YAEVDEWFEPAPDAVNPLAAQPRESSWPLDPFGPYPGDRGTGRRADVEAGAALVRAAALAAPVDRTLVGRAAEWRADVELLLAERTALTSDGVLTVPLPERLSVSQLVELDRDPAALAAALRRPLPRRPAPWARRGTAFHTWLEQRWQTQALLDLDELPGAADEGVDDADFVALRDAFEASEWAHRTPAEVEVPFEMKIGESVIRGRMDAVFRDSGEGGGVREGDEAWLVVDWKTGRRPAGAEARAAAVQLAAYRLAWARLAGIPERELHRVRAAFHYVRTGETVEPTALLDANGLRELITG
ncbi:MAG TPA: PD-(D/E)XK nuclease family protein, partial [Jatrophihabitans sp.]|nr:PD-(D/E)XK nuclease family protein [Jatrophihabitans sp.]